jgi:hypothetical protein
MMPMHSEVVLNVEECKMAAKLKPEEKLKTKELQ